MKIKLLSWNVYDKHAMGKEKKELIKFINKISPDIMCLQESVGFKSAKFKGITLDAWNDNWVEFTSNNKRYENSALIYWNKKFKKVGSKIFRIDTNNLFDFKNFDKKNLITSKSKKYKTKFTEKKAQKGISGGRPLLGIKLKHKDCRKNIIVFCVHLEHYVYDIQKVSSFINTGLNFLDYKSGDRILLLGDFNEFVTRSERRMIIPIKHDYTTDQPISLYMGRGLPTKTCCYKFNSNSDFKSIFNLKYESDLMYDSFNELTVRAEVPKASDHLPLIGELTI